MSANKSRSKKLDEIIKNLFIAQKQSAAGEKGLTHSQVIKKLQQRLKSK